MNTELLRHLCPLFVRRRRGSLARVLAALLALMMLIPTAAQTAHADSVTLCEVNGQLTTNCPPNTNYSP
ncbi:MAG TPA: hypothetical protein VNM16_00095, partial [Bacillota bacterium]|nr:hypothetical protein [Bacillota bacterium]